jgi:hypothetical protein
MNYKEILPSPALRKYVKCFWTLEQFDKSFPNVSETILPDGSIEIVFNLADKFRRFHSNGKIEIQPSAIVVGQMRRAIRIEPLGKINLFGIRFQTIGAYHFFPFSLDELTDKIEYFGTLCENGEFFWKSRLTKNQMIRKESYSSKISYKKNLPKRTPPTTQPKW